MYFIVEEVGFIHHGRMTSYNLLRHILHTHSKSRLCVLHTDSCFNEYRDDKKINVNIVYLFTFILDTGLNSHAYNIYANDIVETIYRKKPILGEIHYFYMDFVESKYNM